MLQCVFNILFISLLSSDSREAPFHFTCTTVVCVVNDNNILFVMIQDIDQRTWPGGTCHFSTGLQEVGKSEKNKKIR